jgi:PilZ domain
MNELTVRRSGRISKAVPILLIGSDVNGVGFSEETRTVVLSLHGAGIVSAHKLDPEQDLILRSLENHREVEVRVIGEIGSKEKLHTYGVSFLRDSPDFWNICFSETSPYAYQPAILRLECGGCKTSLTLENSDFEFDICVVHGRLVRYCTQCGLSTVWTPPSLDKKNSIEGYSSAVTPTNFDGQKMKPVHRKSTPSAAPARRSLTIEAAAKAFAKPAPGTGTIEDRRDRVRAKVNFFACVRSEAFGDEVVTCIDMSRGGLGFKTNNTYPDAMLVRIAVPFSPENKEAPAIYVTARIAHVRPLAGSSVFRCGVEFLR